MIRDGSAHHFLPGQALARVLTQAQPEKVTRPCEFTLPSFILLGLPRPFPSALSRTPLGFARAGPFLELSPGAVGLVSRGTGAFRRDGI